MRLAAISALMYNIDDAILHIVQSFEVLRCVGNVPEMLFVGEIYSLILYRQQRYESAYQISCLCTKLRNDYGMLRMGYVEQLVNAKRAKLPIWVRESVDAPDESSTIYDLIGILNSLNHLQLQAQRSPIATDERATYVSTAPAFAFSHE